MTTRRQEALRTGHDPFAGGDHDPAPVLAQENGAGVSACAGAAAAIVVIERRILIRDCLVRCLRDVDAGCTVLAFASAGEWLDHAAHYVPMLILLSTQMYSPEDEQVKHDLALLSGSTAHAPVVVISDSEDRERVVSVLRSGVRGYIPTSVTLNVALEAMRLVGAGGTFAPASTLIAANYSSAPGAASYNVCVRSRFTARQMAVLVALRHGKANKQIAYELNMREGTVKVHVRHIMKKLKARNRTEAAVMANDLLSTSNNVA